MKKYYFDTSIWLDLFEDRNKGSFAKTTIARKLLDKILRDNGVIVYSGFIILELKNQGYTNYEVRSFWRDINPFMLFGKYDLRLVGKAKDLSKKRGLPLFDAIHALIARENNSILISRDRHFNLLKDICRCMSPEEIID